MADMLCEENCRGILPFLVDFSIFVFRCHHKRKHLVITTGLPSDRCKIFPVFVFGDAGGATTHLGRRRRCWDHVEILGLGGTTLGPHMPYAIYLVNMVNS